MSYIKLNRRAKVPNTLSEAYARRYYGDGTRNENIKPNRRVGIPNTLSEAYARRYYGGSIHG